MTGGHTGAASGPEQARLSLPLSGASHPLHSTTRQRSLLGAFPTNRLMEKVSNQGDAGTRSSVAVKWQKLERVTLRDCEE